MSRRLIDMTEADLDQRDERLLAAVAELLAREAPALVDRAGLAAALSCSLKTLDRLRAEPGFPETTLVDSPRFDVAEVVAFLKASGRGQGLRLVGGAK